MTEVSVRDVELGRDTVLLDLQLGDTHPELRCRGAVRWCHAFSVVLHIFVCYTA